MSDSDSDASTNTVIAEKTRETKMSTFIGNIEQFTLGEDFSNYIERVEKSLTLNKVDDGMKIPFLIGICGADLFKVMKSVIAPQKVDEVSFVELKKN